MGGVIDPRSALDAIGLLPDTEIEIAEAALQFARVDDPRADWQAAHAFLSEIAREAASLSGAGTLFEKAEALADLLSLRYGFRGDVVTYDDLANANLIRVLQRRRGLPVALGVIWLHAARAAGWDAHGVDFPAHFMVALQGKATQLVLDVFQGGTLMGNAELLALLKRIEGDAAEMRPGLLVPMNARQVLMRLQNNIASRRLQAGDMRSALACIEDMLRVAPDHAELWRQAALLNQQLDRVTAALRCYERCLMLVPRGGTAVRVQSAIHALRGRLN
jgi:regulator of sirC expression with transglutaminase-like and TPR domain